MKLREKSRLEEHPQKMGPEQGPASPVPLLRLQRTVGNQATLRFLQRKCSCGGSCDDCKNKSHTTESQRQGEKPELAIGPVDDRHEREADQTASLVMRMTAGQAGVKLQRKCSQCEEEEEKSKILQRDDIGEGPGARAGSDSGVAPPIVHDVLSSPGRALDPATRSFMEPRFGHDFSDVKVHADNRAAESARAVNAQAYTVGRDVVFGAGRYAPETAAGRSLLAHELTHVVQQGSANVLRRAPVPTPRPLPGVMPAAGASDFLIDRVESSTQQEIFFARNSAALTASAMHEIQHVKAAKPGSVRLIGYASADEAAALAQQRADAVKAELGKAPDAVTVTSATGNAAATAERSDFSHARSVEIIVGMASATKLDCRKKVGGKLVNPPTAPCPVMDPATWTEFNNTHPIATDAMKRAVAAVAGVPSASDEKIIDEFFGNHNPATLSTLRTNLGNLEKHVKDLPKNTRCGGQCDVGGCDEGPIAYNKGVDTVPPGSSMTLCVPTFKNLNQNDRARNLIHESAHGTDPLGGAPKTGTQDVAYRHERMLFELKTADRLRNSDSYALFAMVLRERQITKNPAALPKGISTPAQDKRIGFVKPGEEPAVKLALARLEKRLTWTKQWTGQLYGSLVDVKAGRETWATAWGDFVMDEAAKRFPLTSSAAKPKLADQTRMAAIVDRYKRMYQRMKSDLTVTRVPGGIVKWTAAPGKWIAGDSLEIGEDFFKATPDDQVSLLMEQLAASTKDVEPAFVPAYVSLAQWIHSKNP